MSSDQTWTIGQLLKWTADYFHSHGSTSPRLDAEVLLAEAKGCERIELYTTYDQPAEESLRSRFRELVRRRAAGEPVAYLVGHREFYSTQFTVTPDVLIPRPETELLVMQLVEWIKALPSGTPVEIADVGTGSGVIAICAAKHIENCRVTAIDISPAALKVAQANAEQVGVSHRIRFVESDLFAAVPAEDRFHFVASNPPYVSEAEMEELPDEVRRYEPGQALLAGPAGTEVIDRLIPQAAERLMEAGQLAIEVSPMISEAVQERLTQDDHFQDVAVTKDLAGLARIVTAQRSS